MAPLTLCRLSRTEAERLGMAPARAGGWIAAEPAVEIAVEDVIGYGAQRTLLALLPSEWTEAQLRPVSHQQADAIVARLGRMPDRSAAEYARRVRAIVEEV